jgi:hypothetical protein
MFFTRKDDVHVVLKTIYKITRHYAKRGGNLIYTMVSKKMLSYGGNHFTIVRR